jgi:dual specificity protein kinase YAK1
MLEDAVCHTEPSETNLDKTCDNIENELIVYTNDLITDRAGTRYRVDSLLGKGVFGQVFSVTRLTSAEPTVFALKVTKSTSAHRAQTALEIRIMERLKAVGTPEELETICLILDHFDYRDHICILMPVHSINFLTILERHNFHGITLNLIQLVVRQVVKAFCLFHRAGVVHLDIKPENIVLADLYSPCVKVIDFGSSRLIDHPLSHYYVQSRWYRAPEVVLHLSASFPADMWSLGITAAELFFGVALVSAPTEFQMLIEMRNRFGQFPRLMIDQSPRKRELFDPAGNLKSAVQICREHGVEFVPNEPYYTWTTLRENVFEYHVARGKTRSKNAPERARRELFVDFLFATLKLNPDERLTPEEALNHPFITTNFDCQ